MKAYRDSIRAEAAAAGRNPDDVKVLFVLKPTVVGTRAEAEELRARRRELTQRDIDSQLNSISYLSVIDFKQFDLDAPLPELHTNSNQGTLDHFTKAGPPGSTLRQLLQARSGGAGDSIIGTAEEIADYLEEHRRAGGRRRLPLLRVRGSRDRPRRPGPADPRAAPPRAVADQLRRRRLPPEPAGLLAP